MNVEEIRTKVRILCEDAGLQFFFAVPNASEWAVTDCEHLRKIVSCHKELETLPPVTSTQRWIPVSERLPEVHEETYYADHEVILHESDYVLTCCQVGEEFVYAIGPVIYDEVCNSYEWSDLYDYVGYEIDDAQVLAWMPLPEPYKAERESEV